MSSPSKPPRRGSEWNTSEVQAFLECLERTFPDIAIECTEDEESFGFVSTPPSLEDARDWLGSLSAHHDKGSIRLACRIAGGLYSELILRSGANLRVAKPVERNEDLYTRPEDESLVQAVDDLEEALSQPKARISLGDLMQTLTRCAQGGVAVELKITVEINDKGDWQTKFLGRDLGAKVVLFFFPGRFIEGLKHKSLDELARDWFAKPEQPTLLVLLRSRGYLEGDYLACFGLDSLDRAYRWLERQHNTDRLDKIRRLRDQECYWNGKPDLLTPDHFSLQNRGFGGEYAPEIETELQVVAVQLAVGFLAGRTDTTADPPLSRFDGYRTCQVPIDRQVWRNLIMGQDLDVTPFLALYRWAYENYSGDQLGVVRQLVSLELGAGPDGNAEKLLTGAAKMLETARVNLQELVRRNIAEYFAARNQVCEFLRKYTDEIAKTISELTGELIGNLYKTLAAIIGAIVAAEITEKPAVVVLIAAGLYFVYVVFVILYLLPSFRMKHRLKKQEYENNIHQFVQKDVLLEEEIRRFQGQTYQDSDEQFRRYFRVTQGIYILLAVLALLVTVYYGVQVLQQ